MMGRSIARPIRISIALAVGGALALTACGDDDSSDGGGDGGGNGNTEAFCEAFAATAITDEETTPEEDLAAVQAIADVAPSEISPEVDTIVSAFERLQNLDLETASEEEMADFETSLAELDGAVEKFEAYTRQNCPDLPDSVFGE